MRLRKNTDHYRLDAVKRGFKGGVVRRGGTPRDDNDHMIAIAVLA